MSDDVKPAEAPAELFEALRYIESLAAKHEHANDGDAGEMWRTLRLIAAIDARTRVGQLTPKALHLGRDFLARLHACGLLALPDEDGRQEALLRNRGAEARHKKEILQMREEIALLKLRLSAAQADIVRLVTGEDPLR